MIIPKYWAEARARNQAARPRITVSRFGWSDESQGAAETHAQTRAEEALQQVVGGEEVPRRERKVPYNGSDGLPIREEVLETHLDGDAIVTRNSYGAHCLNVRDVLFADVDFEVHSWWKSRFSCLAMLIGSAAGMTAGAVLGSSTIAIPLGGILGCVIFGWLARRGDRTLTKARGGPAMVARARLERFLKAHPEWRVRLYGTPAGLRLLVMHRTFDLREDLPEVERFFQATGSDVVYARMCRLQRCFRARVSPKPWRIGIGDHMRPRPGVWPVAPERLPLREAWIERYEAASVDWASCRLLEVLGSVSVDPKAAAVRDIHDRLAKSESELLIA